MEEIKLLRDKTGAGMMDCKKALDEAGGDLEKAVEILRKKGIAKAAKRNDREASQGIIKMSVSDDYKAAFMVELNSETDFVSRNDKFQAFADEVLGLLIEKAPDNREALLALTLASGVSVKEQLDSLSGVIGEKLDIKRCVVIKSQGTVNGYLHASGSIGVLVALSQADKVELARDIAMQIAASNPKYITPEDVDSIEIEKEKEVYRDILVREGKAPEMIDKILPGKVNKYFEDVCLVKQEFIKDDKQKVEAVLGDTKVESFSRFSL